MKMKEIVPDEVCTTQQAAEILGISVSSVQQLVEAGEIEAWKTKGGHRRIPRHAVLAYRGKPAVPAPLRAAAQALAAPMPGRAPASPAAVSGAGDAPVAIMVIEDNPMQRAIYQRQIDAWQLPVSLAFCENGYQALLQIARGQPDVLLADIVMDGIDGYEVVRTILDDPKLAATQIAILSGLSVDELEERGGVPPGVVFFAKPVNYDELRGYLRACCAQRARRQK